MTENQAVEKKRENPFSVLWGGVKNYFSSFKNIGKDPKRLIPVIVLSVVWILTMLLPACGVNPGIIKVLGFLSFAEAGMSNNVFRIIGGVIGKGMFATALYTLINMIKYRKSATKIPFKDKIKQTFSVNLDSLWDYLLGAGIASFLFLFMAGRVTSWSFMGGVAATFLTVKNILRGGFLSRMVQSCCRTFSPKAPADAFRGVLRGMTVGFSLTTLLGFLGSNLVVIIVAGVLTLGGLTMVILTRCGVVRLGGKEDVKQ